MKEEKGLFKEYNDNKKDIYSSLIETIAGVIPVGLTVKLIEDHQRTTLFNKLSCFYQNTKDLPKAKHQYVIEKLSASKDFKRKAAELLLELIDKTVTDSNIDLLCNLYKNTAEDKISETDFIRLSIALQKCSYTDLISLVDYQNDDPNFTGRYDGSATDSLYAAGLVYQHVIGSPILYKVNNLGADMLRYGIIG